MGVSAGVAVVEAGALLAVVSMALLVSTLVRTQQQAMMTAAFTMMQPMMCLSRLIFPIENMPPAIQAVTCAIPLRYYANNIRGILLRGSGIEVLWPEARATALLGHGPVHPGPGGSALPEAAGLVRPFRS